MNADFRSFFPQRIEPQEGQESVWDYPRPPACEACPNTRIRVVLGGATIVDSKSCARVLETSHPPVYYIPISDLNHISLIENDHSSWCEWKGKAKYFNIAFDGRIIENAGWFYPTPDARFADLQRKLAFYPSKVDACMVDDHRVTPQEGDFYGGWITDLVVGPFKGPPGTRGW